VAGVRGGHYRHGDAREGEPRRRRGYHARMAKLLLNLRNVPDDEADEIRDLLVQHAIDVYETKPSLWGVSAGGIWLADAAQLDQARQLLGQYQQQRAQAARAEREAAVREGRAPSTWSNLRDNPRQAVVAVVGIALMLAIVTLPYLLFSR